MASERMNQLLILAILAVSLLMILALYLQALSPAGTTGLATVLLVLVTVIYTLDTREQVNATRASYAPSLDVSFYPKDDHFALSVVNRGQGVARNIVVHVNVGDYCYRGHLGESLSPGNRLYSPYGAEDHRVAVVPRYYVPDVSLPTRVTTPPRRALRQGKDTPVKAMMDIQGVSQLSLPELLIFKQQTGGGFTSPDGELFVPVTLRVTYSDVNEENEFTSVSSDYDGLNVKAQSGSISSIFQGDKSVIVFERPWVQFKRKYLQKRDALPFEENLDTDVRPV